MKNYYTKFLFFSALSMLFLSSCTKDNDDVNEMPELGKKEFVGSSNCKSCHSEKYGDWESSGHPYKFNVIENGEEPAYQDVVQNFQNDWMAGLGNGTHSWDDIAGVIGGFGWKARFVGKDGHIIGTGGSSLSTGLGHNQINFFDGEMLGWSNYETANTNKIYNYSCFKCHTTGPVEEGTWLEGVDGLGDFSEGGIGCESCHGPGSHHIDDPTKDNIDRVYEFAHTDNSLGGLEVDGVVQTPDEFSDDVNFMCGTCHNRGYTNKIDAKGGFVKHHEQWDELVSGPHKNAGVSCTTCHDPHKRTIWNGDAIVKNCTQCHTDQVNKVNHSGATSCLDCHMPYADKSGAKRGESGFEGDVRSHIFSITVDANSMFNEDGSAVKNDAERAASLDLERVCLGCHNRDANDAIPNKTLQQALAAAKDMHK
jgi:Zn ribbon nucleic-acid-binding protein